MSPRAARRLVFGLAVQTILTVAVLALVLAFNGIHDEALKRLFRGVLDLELGALAVMAFVLSQRAFDNKQRRSCRDGR